jgi:cytochrome c oxidase subunit II
MPMSQRASRPPSRPNSAVIACFLACAACSTPDAAYADPPLGFLRGYGPHTPVALTWGVLIISILTVVIICGILLVALWRNRGLQPDTLPGTAPVKRPYGGLTAIYAGVALSTLVLFGVSVWTVVTLADVASPSSKPKITIEVTGHQWWWEVRYGDDDPSRIFTTANEIHIPVGEPVRVRLKAVDVIHSFWVPRLAGKTDAIPGQINTTWLQADKAGTYRGQCTEYCGLQHAHMGFEVVATSPEKFKAWWDRQLEGAAEPRSESAQAGEQVFVQKCGACHSVRGTLAGGILGPNLSHLMGRQMIAAATLPNRPGYLSGWIADPQSIKPGSMMPDIDLSGPQLVHVRDFLETLR